MTNWLVDPVACVNRLKTERGCNILMGRNEVMSRSTRATRSVERDGTYWRWGHVYAVRSLDRQGKVSVRGGVGSTHTNHTSETPDLMPEHANVLSDLLRAAYVDAGSQECGGQSLYEIIWDEFFTVTDRLIGVTDAGKTPDPDDVGAARSLAWVIAVFQNPYRPDIERVKNQVMNQWEEENG